MASAQDAYEALIQQFLLRDGVTLGRALSNDEVLKIHDKIFAFLKGDRLVVKVPRPVVVELLEAGSATSFTSGGRVMKEWVTVGLDDRDWTTLAEVAFDYVDPGVTDG